MDKQLVKAKRRARRLVLQALYQWSMTLQDISEIEIQFRVGNDMSKVDLDYFCRLLHGIPAELSVIEDSFKPYLDRAIDALNPVELAILRLCTYELLYCLEIPYRMVLDESVSLAKEFGSQDGYRYVNGVLHQVALKTRTIEINSYG